MRYFRFLIVIFNFSLLLTASNTSRERITRDKRQNTNSPPCFCILLKNCPALSELLSAQHVETEVVEYLKNQTCGFQALEPLVCCVDNIDLEQRFRSKARIEKRLIPSSSSEESLAADQSHENEVKRNYFNHHRFGDNHFYPFYFPSHHNYYPSHDYYPKYPSKPPPLSNLPEESSSESPPAKEGSKSELDTVAIRSKLVPDQTCGISLDHRIVGGKKAKLGSYPWIARLGYTRLRSFTYLYKCGGALINSRFVLTAAHCITDLPRELKLATIRLGEQDERTDPDCEGNICADRPQDFLPILVIAHTNYNTPKYKNDIGLVRLDRDADITPYVSPICLPSNLMDNLNYTGFDTVAAGWGTINIDLALSSPVLQDVTLKISNVTKCREIYSTRFQLDVDERQLCTMDEQGKDTCEGDSGGPLMRFQQTEQDDIPRYYLLGIVSFGPKRCGTSSIPAVFTKVSQYLDWIFYHID